jgi:hypothetical protein
MCELSAFEGWQIVDYSTMLYQLQRLINHINLTTASVGMKKLVAS